MKKKKPTTPTRREREKELHLVLDAFEKLFAHAYYNATTSLAKHDVANETFYITSGTAVMFAVDETRQALIANGVKP